MVLSIKILIEYIIQEIWVACFCFLAYNLVIINSSCTVSSIKKINPNVLVSSPVLTLGTSRR